MMVYYSNAGVLFVHDYDGCIHAVLWLSTIILPCMLPRVCVKCCHNGKVMESHKRPSVKGPSGALASLGFARGQSMGSFDEYYGKPGGSSLDDGGSEAGSRFESVAPGEVRARCDTAPLLPYSRTAAVPPCRRWHTRYPGTPLDRYLHIFTCCLQQVCRYFIFP